MRNLETFISPSQIPSIVNQPDIPPVSPEDIFVKNRSTDLPLFRGSQHMTQFELGLMVNAGDIVIDKDLSVKSPTIAEEPSIFTETTSSLIEIFRDPFNRARTIFQSPKLLEETI